MNKEIKDILNKFESVSLEQANKISLMRRKDWKYIFNIKQLPEVLLSLKSKYKILEIDGIRALQYKNTYLDTKDFKFYRQHHNDKLNRFKVRRREYLISETAFLEIKYRTNKQITEKRRRPLNNGKICNSDKDNYSFVKSATNLSLKNLENKLTTAFYRITLLNFENNERMTFDIMLNLSTNDDSVTLDDLVVCELKQDVYTKTFSHAKQTMKKFGIQPYRISKYCIGIMLLNKNIKYNRFKKKLLKINKICDGEFNIK